MGQRVPDEVYLIPETNAWVASRGGIMGLGGRRVMAVGLPLLELLEVDQLRAVLAHELGHYHGGDVMLGPWLYQTRAAIGRTVETLQDAESLLRVLFAAYGSLFLRITHSISRHQELQADAVAARLVGARALIEALEAVHGGSMAYAAYLHDDLVPVLRAGYRPPYVEGLRRFMSIETHATKLREAVEAELVGGKAARFDTHPALPERVAVLHALQQPEPPPSTPEPAIAGGWVGRTAGRKFSNDPEGGASTTLLVQNVRVRRWAPRTPNPRRPDAHAASGPAVVVAGRRRPKRWQVWGLGALVVVFVLAAFVVIRAPGYIEARMKQELSDSWGAIVEIDRIDVRWSRLAVDAFGVRLDDGVRLEVDIERVEIDLSWSDLWGAPRPRLVVHRPAITFEAKPAPVHAEPTQEVGEFGSIEIVDGSLELVVATTRGPAFVDLHEISARIENRRTVAASSPMDLGITASATLGEGGRLQIAGRASSRSPAEAWRVRFELERFDLSTLNQLWLDLVEMDVDHGFVSLSGELTRSPSRLSGRIRPRFEDITLLGAEEDALHPMAEALFGHMLMGAHSTIGIDRPMTDERSSLPELLETDWRVIIQQAIREGYARRLSTLRGFSASIGDVRVDFGQGLLQLFDVVVDAHAPVLDIPLVAISRVDVVFDPAVTRAGTPAYKHVTLWRPTFTFATGVERSENRLQFDESWLDTISAIPFPTRNLIVHEGRIDVWHLGPEPPVNVSVSNIELEGREMASELHRAGFRGAALAGTATVLGEAQASIRVVYEPRAAVPNLDVDMLLEPIALSSLAPALQAFAGVDAVSGRVGFSAHLSARNHEIEASVVPDVDRPKLRSLGRGHGLRKIIVGRALRRLQSRVIELKYAMEPDEGLMQEFFPQLIQAVFLRR